MSERTSQNVSEAAIQEAMRLLAKKIRRLPIICPVCGRQVTRDEVIFIAGTNKTMCKACLDEASEGEGT